MPYLSELERGRKEASSEVLAAICDALRIDLSDLLAEVARDLAADRARAAPSSGWSRQAPARRLRRRVRRATSSACWPPERPPSG